MIDWADIKLLGKYLMRTKQHFLIAMVFLAGLLFYAYEFFLRLLPSAYPDQMMQYFKLDHFSYSFLLSSYNLTYLAMQIPAGMLLDRFGNRRVMTLAIILCGLGNVVFVLPYYETGVLARMMIGFGSAFAFVGILKLSREVLPAKYFATFASIVIAIGTLGGAYAQQFANGFSSVDAWQQIFIYVGLVALPIALFVWVVLHRANQIVNTVQVLPNTKKVWKQLIILIRNKRIWINALMGGLLYAPTVIITAQWGVYFLEHHYQLNHAQALQGITLVLLGWVVASPIIGWCADRYDITSGIIYIGSILLIMTILMFVWSVSIPILWLLFIFGVFSSIQVLVWRNFNQIAPHSFSGVGVALTNMLLMFVVEVMQLISGLILNLSQQNYTQMFYHMVIVMVVAVMFGVCAYYKLSKKR